MRGYWQRWPERLGFISLMKDSSGCIWIHAVSLGEMMLAVPLIRELKKHQPSSIFLITSMTLTGDKLASQQGTDVYHAFVPYDVPNAVKRFLRRARPRLLVIMETELWPNLLHYTAAQNIPILLANARLSERSARGYRFITALTAPMLSCFSLIAAQTQQDADRFMVLGANASKLIVTGSMKFDVPLPMNLVTEGRLLRHSWGEMRSVVIAASTHAGEEDKILNSFSLLSKVCPHLLLILVPRHPERFLEVAALCNRRGYLVVKRSDNKPCLAETQIFLGDSLGELFLYYAAADIAFVGGSLVPVGGHNLLEPAALGLPILTGPYVFNFSEIFRLLHEAGGILCADNETALVQLWTQLLGDKVRCKAMGENALQVVARNHGALEKHCQWIEQHY